MCKAVFGTQDNTKNVKTCLGQLNHGVLETWHHPTPSSPPRPSTHQFPAFPTQMPRAGSSSPTPTDFAAVVTQHWDFQRQHVVQLSPVIFNYHLWSLHKAARGWRGLEPKLLPGIPRVLPNIPSIPATPPCPLPEPQFDPKYPKYPFPAALFPHIPLGCIPQNSWSLLHSWFHFSFPWKSLCLT